MLPSVVVDIGGAAFYAWATMLYTMASIIGTACGGLAKAALGLRRGYLAGVLIVLAGWAGCAVAPHVSTLRPCGLGCCRRSPGYGELRL